MFKKLSLIFILGLAATFFLVACQRAASQGPLPSQATSTGTISIAAAKTPTGMGQIQMIGTTQMIQTMTAMSQATVSGGSLPTTTLAGTGGTPNTFTLVPPTGVATSSTPGITPVVIVASATPGRPASYTLMPGEFPYCIARRFNVNQDELLTLNGLTSAGLLQPGLNLNIPQTGDPFVGERSLHPHPSTYTVSSSEDTIYKVACYYGNIDPTQIIAANSLISPYTLHFNQTLNIP
jgi:LysM repeat protein